MVWANVSFHNAVQICKWFYINQPFINVCLAANSPFFNTVEEFFPVWQCKDYDQNPYTRDNLLQAMDLACGDTVVESCQNWIRHTEGDFPHFLARENVACDVDEFLWPDPAQTGESEAE